MHRKLIAFIILLFVLFPSCYLLDIPFNTLTQPVREKNLSELYNPAGIFLHPQSMVYHSGDSVSMLIISVLGSELMYVKQANGTENTGKLRVSVRIYEKYPYNRFIDSTSINYSINKSESNGIIPFYIPLKLKTLHKYNLHIMFLDQNRKKSTQSFLYVDKMDRKSAQNFLLIDPLNRYPYFDQWFKTNDPIALRYPSTKVEQVFVDYYKYRFPDPAPPFSYSQNLVPKVDPDSTWRYKASDSLIFVLPYEGMYRFRVDSLATEGLMVFSTSSSFPRIEYARDFIDPLIYLTTSKEFERIKSAQIKKSELDYFWLKNAINADIAKEIIRVYYNRVQLANVFFTAHNPGWQTDRGMIYIIFGPPHILYKNPAYEKWIYGTEGSAKAIVFVFDHSPNKYSNNNFSLRRDGSYTTVWRNAIDTWRAGKIFTAGK